MSGGNPKPNKNQIITALYRSVLGREPDSNALMYYISQPEINEDAVRKQMVESEEHKNIIEEYKKIGELKKQIEDLKSVDNAKEKTYKDKEIEIGELNKILKHKSEEISKLKEEIEKLRRPDLDNSHTNPIKHDLPQSARESLFQKLLNKILIK